MKAHLVGGGLASMAAAACLIRDAGVLPTNITIYEATGTLGGCLIKRGDPDTGYVLPTGRIFEREYRCAFDLFAMVPSASDPHKSVKEEILAFNARHGYIDKCHILDRHLNVVKAAHFGLSARDRLALVKFLLTPQHILEGRTIEEFFSPEFFKTEFWMLWLTLMFSLPQHSALEMQVFMLRFVHLLPDFSKMTKILRTRFNQYEAIALPIVGWLERQGVNFRTNVYVTDIGFKPSQHEITANSLSYVEIGETETVEVGPGDVVLVTNGSQVADLAIGSSASAPKLHLTGRSWALWERLALGRPEFGNPNVFFGEHNVPDAQWLSITVTDTDSLFFERISALTGGEPGRSGLITLRDTSWLLTFALFHQPEFLDQPESIRTWWGFGMYPGRAGDFIKKPLSACTGGEILDELLRHLRFDDDDRERILKSSTCVPCLLPFANSVWLKRTRKDRPPVVPESSTNFGFIGQFAELPGEANYTMEYSIRSAREAVSTLLNLESKPPPIYQGMKEPRVLYEVMGALV
jgi:oleate hydratase